MSVDTESRTRQVMANVFGLAPNEIPDDASPDNIKKWNSLAHMSLVIALEEEFNVQFTDVQLIEMMNLPLIVITIQEITLN